MTQDQWLVLARSLANTAATAAVTAGVLSLSQETSLEAGVEHIENGVKEILIGLGIIVPIVTPIWGVLKARLSSQVTAVHQAAPAALVAAQAKAGKGHRFVEELHDRPGTGLPCNAVCRFARFEGAVPSLVSYAQTTRPDH